MYTRCCSVLCMLNPLRKSGYSLLTLSPYQSSILRGALIDFRTRQRFRFPPIEENPAPLASWPSAYKESYDTLLDVATTTLHGVLHQIAQEHPQVELQKELLDAPVAEFSSSFVNLFNYEFGSLGIHRDRCLLTVVFAVSGPSKLWVRHPTTSQWRDSGANEHQAAVFAGEELEALTHGLIPAVEHSVGRQPGVALSTEHKSGDTLDVVRDRLSAALVLSMPNLQELEKANAQASTLII